MPRSLFRRLRAGLLTLGAALLLAACGGGGGDGGDGGGALGGGGGASDRPETRAEAARFLTQASFGPTDAEVERVMALGYGGWIDDQLARPVSSHRAHWEARDAAIRAANANQGAGADQVYEAFWKHAVTGPDQLRQRWAFALSQIFVISLADSAVDNTPRAVSAWIDMLAGDGLGSYRQLLESVSRHPMMGLYLSHLKNQKADPRTGRVPDENYAREVMQLFSIGLVELNEDGSARGSAPTYGPADVAGLAQVFTGFSWACPDWPDNGCFSRGQVDNRSDPNRDWKPMAGYPQYHSADEKRFLGTVIPAQPQANPETSLRAALDAIAAHPNVGPFIGRQLIQRLVTSNPSPAYVTAVARAFADNGQGVRGDLKAVLKAVLLHPEARQSSDSSGRLREPVLRLAAFLRAFGHQSDTGFWRIGNTDNPATSLGQTPLRSPSVFNFYRPGYLPPGTGAAARGLVVPEMQITHETTVAGYVNAMRDAVATGVGASNGAPFNRRDVQAGYAAELALADDPAALVAQVAAKLMPGRAGLALQAEIAEAVGRIVIPALKSDASNQNQVDGARRSRVHAAVLLALVSPEFQVQP